MTYIELFIGLAVLGFSITYLVRTMKFDRIKMHVIVIYALAFAGGGTIFIRALVAILKLA